MMDSNEVKVYKEILKGNRKRFPLGFWKSKKKQKTKCIFKYLIEEVLKWDVETVATDFNYTVVSNHKLTVPFTTVYNRCVGNVINDIYPDFLKGKRMPCSEETKTKISNAQKSLSPEKREKITKGSRVKYKSKEYIKKISDTKLGETNPQHKLKTEQVLEIKRLWGTGIYTTATLGVKFSISRQSISDIVYGRTWKHVLIGGED